jgi:hypothetical protein
VAQAEQPTQIDALGRRLCRSRFDRLDADAHLLVRLEGKWLVGDEDLAVEVGI